MTIREATPCLLCGRAFPTKILSHDAAGDSFHTDCYREVYGVPLDPGTTETDWSLAQRAHYGYVSPPCTTDRRLHGEHRGWSIEVSRPWSQILERLTDHDLSERQRAYYYRGRRPVPLTDVPTLPLAHRRAYWERYWRRRGYRPAETPATD